MVKPLLRCGLTKSVSSLQNVSGLLTELQLAAGLQQAAVFSIRFEQLASIQNDVPRLFKLGSLQ